MCIRDSYYRGISVSELARESTVEEVAALLWTGDRALRIEEFVGEARLDGVSPTLIAGLASLAKVERMQALLPAIGAADPAAFATAPPHIHQCGARILRFTTLIATAQDKTVSGIAQTLQSAWLPGRPEMARLIEAALILCADHELNVSTFTCRTVASSGASLYAVVTAGLSALQGPRHGGATDRLEALWDEAESANSVGDTIVSRLKRGDVIEGFGHVVYRGVDPRAKILMELLEEAVPNASELALAKALIEEVGKRTGLSHNVDLGLVALRRALGLEKGAALLLFCLGRIIGWIAHAIEQYQTGRLIRPRAKYTGPEPRRASG